MKKNNLKNCIIFCTVPDKNEAIVITKYLLINKYAACINIIPKITSYYYWNNKLEKKQEFQILIKTNTNLQRKIFKIIKKKHSYKIPELFSLEISQIDIHYLNWIKKTLF